MDNEELFLMLEECVERASAQLTSGQNLESFAMVLEEGNTTRHIHVDDMGAEERYEALLEVLRTEVKTDKINALALLSNVTIPENFNPAVSTGIRIHIEEKQQRPLKKNPSEKSASKDFKDKLGARLLYVPYQLFKTTSDDTIQIQLHNPIPVGLACEIF